MVGFQKLPRWLLWSLLLPLVVLNGWVALKIFEYFHSFFTIAIVATLFAFILSFPVTWLQRFRISRAGAVGIVLLLVLVAVGIAGVTLLPLLFDQVAQLSKRLPEWFASTTSELQNLQTWATQRQLPVNLTSLGTQLESRLSSQIQQLSGLVIGALPSAIANVLDIFLTLVLTVYLLLHGQQVWDSLFRWLPVTTGQRLKPAISESFRNYFMSQAAIALMMGTTMTLAFLIIRVPFGLLFGIAVGAMALVPYGGAVGIVAVSCLTALSSVWLGLRVLIVAAVIDQIIENAIAPQLVGKFIGLNPVWILVSLLIGTQVGGLLGLVVAVPIASTIKVLLVVPPVNHPPTDKSLTDNPIEKQQIDRQQLEKKEA